MHSTSQVVILIDHMRSIPNTEEQATVYTFYGEDVYYMPMQ